MIAPEKDDYFSKLNSQYMARINKINTNFDQNENEN